MGVTLAEFLIALVVFWAVVRSLGRFQRRLEDWILARLGRPRRRFVHPEVRDFLDPPDKER